MKSKMQELLGLLTMVVERVRAANERAERAEARADRMAALLDALSDENAELRSERDRAGTAAADAQETVRVLRERTDAGARLVEVLEARVADAELRILRAADALGQPIQADPHTATAETSPLPLALH